MNNDGIVKEKFQSGPLPLNQRGDKEVFLVTHEIFDIDKYCFPGIAGNTFFQVLKWPKEIAKIFEEVGKLTEKNNVRLIRGEVRKDESLTYIWVESETQKDIENFYVAFEEKLISVGHHYNFNTVKIIPDSCQECTESNLDRDFETEMALLADAKKCIKNAKKVRAPKIITPS